MPRDAKYNHAFTISFSVDSHTNDPDLCLQLEKDRVVAAMLGRIKDVLTHEELVEACECYDTYSKDE